MLTHKQIAWAAAHDWFVRDNGDGTITVHDWYTIGDALFEERVTWRGSFSELRAWAGY